MVYAASMKIKTLIYAYRMRSHINVLYWSEKKIGKQGKGKVNKEHFWRYSNIKDVNNHQNDVPVFMSASYTSIVMNDVKWIYESMKENHI